MVVLQYKNIILNAQQKLKPLTLYRISLVRFKGIHLGTSTSKALLLSVTQQGQPHTSDSAYFKMIVILKLEKTIARKTFRTELKLVWNK